MRRYRVYLTRLVVLLVSGALFFVGGGLLLNGTYIDTTLKDKVYLLDLKPDIYFAGDSRAQRQLNPVVFNAGSRTGARAVNIATEAGSVLSLWNLAAQRPAAFEQATLIVSVSSAHINDQGYVSGAFPEAMIARLNLLEQVRMFLPDHFETLQVYYRRAFKSLRKSLTGRLKSKEENPETLGFKPIQGVWSDTSVNVDFQLRNHPWHKDGWQPDGFKWNLVKESLLQLQQHAGRLIVFAGPIAPGYRQAMAGTAIMEREAEFDAILSRFCSEQHLECRSYTTDKRFADPDFYDPYHLNEAGASKLTTLLIDDFNL